ncbi:MAG: nucleotidyltransferase domain-containing protein [Patescibacteria group bacterium]
MLATGHRVLATWIAHNGAPGKRRNVPLPRPFDEAHYVRTDAWYRLPVVRLVRTLRRTCRKYLAHAFIHGSYATEDYKADWSDLDTLVVLRAEVACSSALLRTFRIQAIRMRRYLYMVDSLQHHGHIVLSETDFEYYPESFFPTVLFAYTIPVFASERIQVTQRPGNAEAATAYEDLLQYLRHTDLTAITANLFAYKLFLHIVQLIPVAALQARGEQVYKRESFAKARPLASAVAWAAITEASRVRSTWDYRGWCSNGIGRTLVELLPNPQPLFALNLVFNTGLTLTQKQEAAVILRAARQLAEELSPS